MLLALAFISVGAALEPATAGYANLNNTNFQDLFKPRCGKSKVGGRDLDSGDLAQERIREHFITLEIGIGDYVLSGGELPAVFFSLLIILFTFFIRLLQ